MTLKYIAVHHDSLIVLMVIHIYIYIQIYIYIHIIMSIMYLENTVITTNMGILINCQLQVW